MTTDSDIEFFRFIHKTAKTHIEKSATYVASQHNLVKLTLEAMASMNENIAPIFEDRLVMKAVRRNPELQQRFAEASKIFQDISHRSNMLEIERKDFVFTYESWQRNESLVEAQLERMTNRDGSP